MVKKGKSAGPDAAAWAATAAVGTGLAFMICLLLMMAGAALIASGKLPEGAMTRVGCVGLALGCLTGGLYTALTLHSRMLPAALTVSAGAVLLWLAIGQGMYGSFSISSLLRSMICALVGGVTAGMLAAGGKKSRN